MFVGVGPVGEVVAASLEGAGADTVRVRPGTRFAETGPRDYEIDPASPADIDALMIGIGEDRRSRSFPSHTTRHAGPHLAVR